LCSDGLERALMIKELHTKVKEKMKRKIEKYAKHANRGRKKVIFSHRDFQLKVNSSLNQEKIFHSKCLKGLITMPMYYTFKVSINLAICL